MVFSGHKTRLPRWAMIWRRLQGWGSCTHRFYGQIPDSFTCGRRKEGAGKTFRPLLDCRRTQSTTRSLRPFAAEKWAYLRAGIVISSPVAGLRPLRADRDLVE